MATVAVWLNDELLVSPLAVAGLRMAWTSGDPNFGLISEYRKMRWYILVVWTSGETQGVWWQEGVRYDHDQQAERDRLRPEAEAEMGRLSDLLWPKP